MQNTASLNTILVSRLTFRQHPGKCLLSGNGHRTPDFVVQPESAEPPASVDHTASGPIDPSCSYISFPSTYLLTTICTTFTL